MYIIINKLIVTIAVEHYWFYKSTIDVDNEERRRSKIKIKEKKWFIFKI